jgi:iron(III) transport system substrate-binding protein
MNSARLLASLAFAGTLVAGPAFAQGEVNLYTYRETKLIQPLLEAFSKDTGVKVNVISAANGLDQRIKTEGANSPADVLLTVDISRLEDAVQAGITAPINSKAIDAAVPAQYRDPEGHWAAVALRARRLRLEGARAADRDHL